MGVYRDGVVVIRNASKNRKR